MSVNQNPYNKWKSLRRNGDYRDNTSQVTSLVRQQLSEPEYLRASNRVNPGPNRNTRAKMADNTEQIPHVFGPEDMWGWQSWTSKYNFLPSELAPTLFEEDYTIPGISYKPYNSVGGASYLPDGLNYYNYFDISLDQNIYFPEWDNF